MTDMMTREEILKRLPIGKGKGSANSINHYVELGSLAALRMDIILADDDTDWEEVWNVIESELDNLLKDEDEWEKKGDIMKQLTHEQLRDYEFKIELILRKHRLCQRLTVKLNRDGCMYFSHVPSPATPEEFLRVSEASLELSELLSEIEEGLK